MNGGYGCPVAILSSSFVGSSEMKPTLIVRVLREFLMTTAAASTFLSLLQILHMQTIGSSFVCSRSSVVRLQEWLRRFEGGRGCVLPRVDILVWEYRLATAMRVFYVHLEISAVLLLLVVMRQERI